MRRVETASEVRKLAAGAGTVGLVPTMGFLHEGHLSLVDRARQVADRVVMSVFVNPLQFDRPADLERYPRDLERDADLAERAGVDVLYAPAVEEVYPESPLTTVTVRGIADAMEGAHRPGHFEGVATVVAKLFASLQPDLAFFGRKDHQQLIMIRRMSHDLSFPVDVVSCPTVREPDGLALSSRNVLLTERESALSISRSLFAAADIVESGTRGADDLTDLVRRNLQLDSVEYVTLASQSRAEPITVLDQPAFLALAGTSGQVRLIDNLPIDMTADSFVPDRGVRLDEPSRLARP